MVNEHVLDLIAEFENISVVSEEHETVFPLTPDVVHPVRYVWMLCIVLILRSCQPVNSSTRKAWEDTVRRWIVLALAIPGFCCTIAAEPVEQSPITVPVGKLRLCKRITAIWTQPDAAFSQDNSLMRCIYGRWKTIMLLIVARLLVGPCHWLAGYTGCCGYPGYASVS